MHILPLHHHDGHEHELDRDDMGGLHRDLSATGAVLGRRRLLKLAMGAGALAMFGCADSTNVTGDTNNNGQCTRIPEETQGPFPADGSNGASVLNQTGVVRSDIRSSFAGFAGTAVGVPLTIRLTLVSSTSCAPLAGRAVYLWHADALGRYSLYTAQISNQNYLRGTQAADANGIVTFQSIFPGCYAGRWPHIHFEVYQNLAAATNVANKVATSQIALPKAPCDAVYATSNYTGSAQNLSLITLAQDNVFGDGASLELATVTGDVTNGYTATITVAVNA